MRGFVDSHLPTVIASTLSIAAAYWCWKGAMLGMLKHRVPRVVLSIGITFMAASYTLSLLDLIDTNTRRSILLTSFWVVCIGLILTSKTGIAAGRALKIDNARLDLLEKEVREYGAGDDE